MQYVERGKTPSEWLKQIQTNTVHLAIGIVYNCNVNQKRETPIRKENTNKTISTTLQSIKASKHIEIQSEIEEKERIKFNNNNQNKITILSKYYIFICILYSYHVPLSMHTEIRITISKKRIEKKTSNDQQQHRFLNNLNRVQRFIEVLTQHLFFVRKFSKLEIQAKSKHFAKLQTKYIYIPIILR